MKKYRVTVLEVESTLCDHVANAFTGRFDILHHTIRLARTGSAPAYSDYYPLAQLSL